MFIKLSIPNEQLIFGLLNKKNKIKKKNYIL